MCHQCQDDLFVLRLSLLAYDDCIVYLRNALRKKNQEQQRQRDECKPLDDSRNIVRDCVICQKLIVREGEVCIVVKDYK